MVYHQRIQVFDQDSLRLGFWPLVNPNQLHWANQGMIRRWGLWCMWGSFHGYMELIEARFSPLNHFIRELGLRLINAWPNSSIKLKKSTVVNCTWSDGFGGGNELDALHLCWNKCYLTSQSLRMKKIKSGQKTAKNRKWLVIEVFKNGKFWTSKPRVQGSFKWNFVQHESCRSCSHLSKKSKNS